MAHLIRRCFYKLASHHDLITGDAMGKVISPTYKIMKRYIRGESRTLEILKRTPDIYTQHNENNTLEIDQPSAKEKPSLLEECKEDVSHIAPIPRPTLNFATYADTSEVIKELVNMGVDFYKLEFRKEIPFYLLRLDYKKHIEPHINFIRAHSKDVDMGDFITKNPYIFKESLDDLTTRINYLESKRFTPEMISRIISSAPRWLSMSTEVIDEALGYFQVEFSLRGDEVRFLATRSPKLILAERVRIMKMKFTLAEEMGFSKEQVKALVLEAPKIFVTNVFKIKNTFEVLHNEMGIPHEMIVNDTSALKCRSFRIRERHNFLKELGRAQYDPTKENFITLKRLVSGTDAEFCTDVAKTSVETYNLFLKSQ